MASKQKVTSHFHRCTECYATYLDNCVRPNRNARCNSCISGIASKYAYGRRPAACCATECRLASKDEIKTYRLAGEGPWFVCGTCRRQHGFDPREDTT